MPNKVVCWDSGLFICALAGGEPTRTQEELDGLREVWDLAKRKQVRIITSATATGEVLTDSGTFEQLFLRPEFWMASTTPAVWKKVRDLRDAVAADGGRRLQLADATYIATALIYRASSLQTFDDKLLRLSGRPSVEGLTIMKPKGEQTVMEGF